MTNDEPSCDCCEEHQPETTIKNGSGEHTPRWLSSSPVTDDVLPVPLQSALKRLSGGRSVETLGEWVAVCRNLAGGSIAREDLCEVETEAPHWGEIDGVRRYYRCFFDAVLVAGCVERPVDVHTVSPAGTTLEMRVTGVGGESGVELDTISEPEPPIAVSFGVGLDFETETAAGGSQAGLEAIYPAICPYVKAFPTRAAYERWARTVPAVTVGMTLSALVTSMGELCER